MADIWRRFRELPGWVQVVAVLVVIGAAGSLMDDGSVPEQRPDETQAESDSTRDDSLPPNQARMSRSELDDEWPLTVEEGIVSCEGAGEVYFMAEGRRYAVNGLAIGAKEAPEIDAIWADDPEMEGLKINIGPIIDTGLQLCE